MKKLLLSLPIAIVITLIAWNNSFVSNGEATLKNVVGERSVCHAESVFTQDSKYTVLIICSDLVYPPNSDTLYYVVWANPSDGSDAIKLGDLGLGRVEFKIDKKITSLFVTQENEQAQRVRTPGTVVLRGNLQPFEDLRITTGGPVDESIIATPAPTPRTSAPSVISRLTGGALITVVSVIVIIIMLVLVKPFK